MKGIFITFEGSEGCGKSTQSRLLYEYLKGKGCRVIYLREPGGTSLSEKIRKILLHPQNHITAECEMLLYMASRAQAVSEVIRPALKKGKIVICDRFLDSTLVYQGFGLGIDIGLIKRVGNFVNKGVKPDLTILLDLAVKKGLRHRALKKDRIERRPYLYHLRVRRGYLKLARLEPGRIKVVEVDSDKQRTQANIRRLAEGICHSRI
jgi:dTMP kinase